MTGQKDVLPHGLVAVRVAQHELESLRAFSTYQHDASLSSFSDIRGASARLQEPFLSTAKGTAANEPAGRPSQRCKPVPARHGWQSSRCAEPPSDRIENKSAYVGLTIPEPTEMLV